MLEKTAILIFLESMRSSETKRMYVRNLKNFLNLIPNNMFEGYLEELPTYYSCFSTGTIIRPVHISKDSIV